MRGTRGTFFGAYQGVEKRLPDVRRPPIPPGMKLGGHGGAHGPLTEEFVRAETAAQRAGHQVLHENHIAEILPALMND